MKRLLFYLSLLFVATMLSADSSGIIKARLFRGEHSLLVLEADVLPYQESYLSPPLFPPRYRFLGKESIDQGEIITVRYSAVPYGREFSDEDSLILPWIVNGVSLSVIEGGARSFHKVYPRALGGIDVPMAELFPREISGVESLREWLSRLLEHRNLMIPFLLLAMALAGGSPGAAVKRWGLLLGGMALILPLGESGIAFGDLLFSQILTLFLTFILTLRSLTSDSREGRFEGLILLAAGLIIGLGLHGEVSAAAESPEELAGLYILSLIFLSGVPFSFSTLISFGLSRWENDRLILRKGLLYAAGILAVFSTLQLYTERAVQGNTAYLIETEHGSGDAAAQAGLNLRGSSRGIISADVPLSLFAAVDPYEVRLEILLRLDALLPEGTVVLEPEQQESFLDELEISLEKSLGLAIDGTVSSPLRQDVSFVKQDASGIIKVPSPRKEFGESGLVGASFSFPAEAETESLVLDWSFFPEDAETIPLRLSYPWGDRAYALSRGENKMEWRNPVVPAEDAEKLELDDYGLSFPYLSFLLALSIPAFIILRQRRGLSLLWLVPLVLGAVLTYPLPRFRINAAPRWTAVNERRANLMLDGLLTNLYRSFEIRDESLVYDRLARSVEGELLQEVYLSNRDAMVMQERGGARARVDDVLLLALEPEGRGDRGGILFRADWSVSGSVSHYGHTHYRRNRYNGIIELRNTDDGWRIADIKMLREEREL